MAKTWVLKVQTEKDITSEVAHSYIVLDAGNQTAHMQTMSEKGIVCTQECKGGEEGYQTATVQERHKEARNGHLSL